MLAGNFRKYQVRIVGESPLICHHDNIEWADKMDEWKNDPANKKFSKAGDDRTPAFRWIGCLYHDGETVSISSDNLSRCWMEGGAMVLVPGGKRGKTFKSQTQSGMHVIDAYSPLLIPRPNKEESVWDELPWAEIAKLENETDFSVHKQAARDMGFSLFIKRARIGTSKHIRVRPKFDQWAVEFGLSVWDDQLTLDTLKSIISSAGAYKGLCDWRPGGKTPGNYGMFRLESIQEA